MSVVHENSCQTNQQTSKSSRAMTSGFNFGLVLDIDGVFIRGEIALEHARQSIDRLDQLKIPYVFLTNGGGCLEEVKAQKLGEILDIDINASRMILSHTPMREIAAEYGEKKVLVLGSLEVREVAKSYGFQKVVTPEDIIAHSPSVLPFGKLATIKECPYASEEIEAIIVMHDPVNWGQDLQVTVDALLGGVPLGSGREDKTQTPIFVSNDDFLLVSEYPVPRFAEGAFTDCLSLLYKKLTGRSLELTRYGKPHPISYNFAENLLNSIQGDGKKIERIYGIGDNPYSDIQGANNAGDHWISILLRTGVFNQVDEENHSEHAADIVCDTIRHAIDEIFILEKVFETSTDI